MYQPPPAPQPYPQPRKRFWTSTAGILTIIGLIAAGTVVVCGGLMTLGIASDRAAAAKMKAQVTSCEFSGGDILPSATVGYTVTNTGSEPRAVTLKIEYRDNAGARIDTDTAYVKTIAPGDTVRAEETTLLDAAVDSGRCVIVGVS